MYLQSVDSPDDMLADGFLSISYMEKQQMADALASLFQEDAPQAENLPGALELTVRDSAGYVTEVTCGRTVANGEAVRQALHLNSACFYFFRAGWKDTDFDKRHWTWARSEPIRCQRTGKTGEELPGHSEILLSGCYVRTLVMII